MCRSRKGNEQPEGFADSLFAMRKDYRKEEEGLKMEQVKKALLVTRVSGFVPQFEMNNVRLLQEMGYQVHYAANFHTIVYGQDNSRLEGTGIICHQIDFFRSPFSAQVRKSYCQLRELLQKESFDLIHCHMPMSGVVARLAAESVRRKTGRQVPVLYTAHGLHFYKGAPLQNWIYYPVERYLSRYTDRLILINQEDYSRALRFPVRGSVEYIKGIGMELSRYGQYRLPASCPEGGYRDASLLRSRFGIGAGQKILISVGELTKRKNHIVMIEAMAILKELPLVYLICGTGPMEETLRRRVQELGLEKRVFFAGYVNEVPRMLSQADCFVFPSLQEGLPVAVMEAMAVGLPVIATGIRGITDLIEHTKGGYLVEDFKPAHYADAIRRLFTAETGIIQEEQELRRYQMGVWNQERIQAFSLPVVEEKMRRIYRSLSD